MSSVTMSMTSRAGSRRRLAAADPDQGPSLRAVCGELGLLDRHGGQPLGPGRSQVVHGDMPVIGLQEAPDLRHAARPA